MAAAAVAVATSVLKIPTPATSGYLNFGDVLVIYFGFRLGAKRGAVAGAMGSAAADLLGGYGYYVPVTCVAKGLEGWLAGRFGAQGASLFSRYAGAIVGALVMVASYYTWHGFVVGWVPALANLPSNLLQGSLGVIGALALDRALRSRGIGKASD